MMKYGTIIAALAAGAVVLTSSIALAQSRSKGKQSQSDRPRVERTNRDFDRDRLRDRDRAVNPAMGKKRDQYRIHQPDFANLKDRDIYGSEVMSAQERNQYRKQLQEAATPQARKQVEAQHRETVMTRAQKRGVKLATPGQGIYGGAHMSVEERNSFREQLRLINSDQEKLRFKAEHKEKMRIWAKSRGMNADDLE